ncbi:hypothetical protein AM232_18795 [Bacillus sp. FJAT-21352]|nr:hypothetical protein AM232_18795 [Bacillus sp. FJAT-21352]
MSSNQWSSYKLSDLMDIIGGGTPKTSKEEYWNGNIPWLSVKDFNSDFKKVYCTEKHISKLGLDKSSTNMLDEGDIIISARGTVGALAQLGAPMTFNQSCYGLKANDKTFNDFLYYLVKYKIENIQQNTHGSIFDTITRDTFNLLDVCIPDKLEEQKSIANILSSLDEKIEINNKINQKLEEMAQAIFKQWFIDFEFPNEEGKPYKSSGGAMVESELGMIPDGWGIGTVNDLGTIIGGGTPSKKHEEYYTELGVPWITPKDLSINKNRYISRGKIDITEDGLKKSSAKLMPKGTVLFSSRAPIGYIAIAKNEVTTNQGFKSIIPKSEFGTEFIYQFLLLNTEVIESRASGSTFKEISGGELKKIPAILPKKEIINKFNSSVEIMGIQIENNEETISNLTTIRDILLPKLMSGEIRVPVEEQ